jgi:predicted small lipoprotein YifL
MMRFFDKQSFFSSPPRKRGSRGDSPSLALDSRFRGNDDRKTGLAKCVQALAVLLIVLAVAACGKKGPPAPPPDQPNTYPKTYPKE